MPELGFHYVGEKNTVLQIETEKDLTTATTLEIHYQKPEDTEVIATAAAVAGDAGDSVAEITIPELDIAGEWKAQVYAIFPAPWEGLGRTVAWEVFNKYATPE